MEALTEIITSVTAHPRSGSVFAYGSSSGCVRVCDLRSRALCDSGAKRFFSPPSPALRPSHPACNFSGGGGGGGCSVFGAGDNGSPPSSIYDELMSSVLDCKFTPCGTYFACRDFMSLKVSLC